MMVQHHTKYIELHGVDETVEMTWSEHKRLHLRLRREGKCNVPVDEMNRISAAANERSSKRKAYKKVYHAEHKEQIKEYKTKYNAEHRDRINERARVRHAARKREAMKDEPE